MPSNLSLCFSLFLDKNLRYSYVIHIIFVCVCIPTHKMVKRFETSRRADVNIVDAFQFHGCGAVCFAARDVGRYLFFE